MHCPFACVKKKDMDRAEERRVLDIAITARRQPRHTAAGRTIVATGQGEGRKKYLVLANGRRLTQAGEYWYSETGQERPNAHFDRQQEPTRKGDGDYIRTRQGLQRVRRLEPGGQMKLTALGRKFYQDKQAHGIRRGGSRDYSSRRKERKAEDENQRAPAGEHAGARADPREPSADRC